MAKNRSYTSVGVVCPYYKSEEKQLIYCRGPQVDTAIHVAFAYPADKVKYKEKFCERDYRFCGLARMLEEVTYD